MAELKVRVTGDEARAVSPSRVGRGLHLERSQGFIPQTTRGDSEGFKHRGS